MELGRVVVVPYDTGWPSRFQTARRLLDGVLAPWLEGGIHHVGSTAVPGIAAKPIVDMVAGVRELEEARAALPALERHGYVHDPHRPGVAHHLAKPSPQPDECRFGLHLTEPGSDLWRERLAFRDALRSDLALTREYERLKLCLAAAHAGDLRAYTEGKREFVARVLASVGEAPGRR